MNELLVWIWITVGITIAAETTILLMVFRIYKFIKPLAQFKDINEVFKAIGVAAVEQQPKKKRWGLW